MIYLPPANEVWGKVICLQVCVCQQGGACFGGVWSGGSGAGWVPGPRGVPALGGACSRGVWPLGGAWSLGVPGPRGCLLPGGCLVGTPRTATAVAGTHPTRMHSC